MERSARLQALRPQLAPHFLFNSLGAVQALVDQGRSAEAKRLIGRLGECLRMMLDTVERHEITIAEELEFLRRYLEIEQSRFGGRLQLTIDVAPDAYPALVPSLLLQPLVENALKHGVLRRERGGAVAISVGRRADRLVASVSDDGPGLASGARFQHGVGLANTTARLQALYAGRARLSVGAGRGGGTAATVELPYRTAREPC